LKTAISPHGKDTVAMAYRRFGKAAAERSSLYERVAIALSESPDAQRVIGSAPARSRRPASILAALHDLALSGRAPELATAYAARDPDAAGRAAIEALLRMHEAVVAVAARRTVRSDVARCYAVLYPAVAEAARRVGAVAVGLIDIGGAASLNLNVDRVAITYDDGTSLGDPASPVRQSCSMVGRIPVPAVLLPTVVAKVGVDKDALDPADTEDARWLRACMWPEERERAALLEKEIILAATARPLLMRADPIEALHDAIAHVPDMALPIVMTTWALSRLSGDRRSRFVDRLVGASGDRLVAWVSVEGVGGARSLPTLGDRRASGHSLVGVTIVERSARRAEVVGRCWSRGRMFEWLVSDDRDPTR